MDCARFESGFVVACAGISPTKNTNPKTITTERVSMILTLSQNICKGFIAIEPLIAFPVKAGPEKGTFFL
jgi:hypothetical protein